MRIKKSLTNRSTTYLKEPKAKYFLVLEGEKSEVEYFEQIYKHRQTIGIKEVIEIKCLLRSFSSLGVSNPKRLVDMMTNFVHEQQNDEYSFSSIIEIMVDKIIEENYLQFYKTESTRLYRYLYKKLSQIYDVNTKFKTKDEILDLYLNMQSLLHSIKPFTDIEEVVNEVQDNNNIYDPDLDKLCLIVDRDKKSFDEEQYDYVLRECKRNNYKLYISNPCFELWLLFHYTDKINIDKMNENRKITSKKTYAHQQLLLYNPNYRKNDIDFLSFLPLIRKAITNSLKFETNIIKLKDNVGSNIGILIEELLKQN